jgi:predicted nucleotidyltransferase
LKNTNIKDYAFGSRTKQNYRQYSDLDLALKLEDKKIEYKLISNLKYDF